MVNSEDKLYKWGQNGQKAWWGGGVISVEEEGTETQRWFLGEGSGGQGGPINCVWMRWEGMRYDEVVEQWGLLLPLTVIDSQLISFSQRKMVFFNVDVMASLQLFSFNLFFLSWSVSVLFLPQFSRNLVLLKWTKFYSFSNFGPWASFYTFSESYSE